MSREEASRKRRRGRRRKGGVDGGKEMSKEGRRLKRGERSV